MKFFLQISLSLFLLLIPVEGSAQYLSLSRKIDGLSLKRVEDVFVEPPLSNGTNYLLHFNHCSYNSGLLPVYNELVELPGHILSPEFNIQITKVKTIDPAIVSITDLQNLTGTELIVKADFNKIRKKNYLELSFVPFMKDAATGMIQQVVAFDILIYSKSINVQKSIKKSSIPQSSVLSTGDWVKLKIQETGIYKLSYEELAGLLSDPSTPQIYGNGGKMLPVMNYEPRDTGLIKNAIWLEKGGDGIFNEGDYMLFYGQGPVSWEYNATDSMFLHKMHFYDDASYYFLTSGNGASNTIQDIETPAAPPDQEIYQYDQYYMHELETENLIRSGIQWFEPLPPSPPTEIVFPGENISPGSVGKLKIRVAARSASSSNFYIKLNSQSVTSLTVSSVILDSYTSNYARTKEKTTSFLPNPGTLAFEVEPYNINPSSSKFWLDFLTINLRKDLVFEGAQMHFRDIESVQASSTGRFHLKHNENALQIWDITDIHNIGNISLQSESAGSYFIATTDSLRKYIAFRKQNFLVPEVTDYNLPNQNLRSLINQDMIIVVPAIFKEQAERVAAFHREKDQLTVMVVEPEEVYNEFSSGTRDAAAIRDFMKNIYDNSDSESLLKYLLLYGDGSFDNRSDHENNSNLIPTYQSWNSLSPVLSYVTDDFYGLLDDSEGGASGLIDIGIGRIPSNTLSEASSVADKILSYYDTISYSGWRNQLCFVGDDEDNNIHMRDANTLCENLDTLYPSFNIQKIFLDAYEQVSTPAGESYPDVNRAINEAIESGILIFNYTGHGNERGLAHEDILGLNDIQSWTNRKKLPLFITATCEFSRFDDIDKNIYGEITKKTSAGEHVLLNPEGGGIALLTTTRLVYSSPNFILNQNFYKFVFENDANGEQRSLGDVLRLTKNESGAGINKRNFTLLGDPALKLAYPKQFVFTDSINGVPASSFHDTLKGLSLYSISGHIENHHGDTLHNMEGSVIPSVYDKKSTVKTLSNNGTAIMEFEVQNKIIYKGRASIHQGQFNFTFQVPKDISFQTGPGKISYYAQDRENETDARGYLQDLMIGGISDTIEADTLGPEIKLYLNDEHFISGGLTDNSPILFALVSDESGINTIGTGIGHDIIAILDDEFSNPFILNNYFESDLDTYKSGSILFPFSKLSKGEHTLSLKVWDVYNNSSTASICFRVSSEKSVIQNIMNYPNPFSFGTSFSLEHNLPDTDLLVTIHIYNLSGRIIKTIQERFYTTGYRIDPIYWDGKNENGNYVESGFFIYKAIISSREGTINEITGKMVKIR
ncbi:MAG: type IX secretion system sortase PorU [Bacteroidota bacterium]|nr:type IX secretion system sortase PorU [Bacteroidota bacterium]